MSTDPRRALVIGAGLVGICSALELRRCGFEATLVDRQPPAHGCSFGNAGILATRSCVPLSMPGLWRRIPRWTLDPLGPIALKPAYLPRMLPWLARFARAGARERIPALADAILAIASPAIELYRSLLAGSGYEGLVRDASYVFVTRASRPVDLDALEWRLRRERGATAQPLTGAEIRELEPALSPEYRHGVLVPGIGRTVNPGRLGAVLAERFRAEGGAFHQAEVRRLEPGAGGATRVHTDDGILDAPWVVIAAGAFSGRLAAELRFRLPIEGERGYHLHCANPGVELHNCVGDLDRHYAASSMEGGVRLAGTSEFNRLDAPPDWRRAEVLKALGRRLIPDLNVDDASPWMGHRPAVPDSVPVIGPLPGHPRVLLACGHGHLGLTGAPMTGRIIAALASGERMNLDLRPYRPDRFS